MSDTVLLVDISNGLYTKLAIASPNGQLETSKQYPGETLNELKASITEFLDVNRCSNIAGAAISAGGWDVGGIMSMPNHNFVIRRDEMRDFLGVRRLNLVNDCVAKALAIPHLQTEDLTLVAGRPASEDQTRALINVTNGLGVAIMASDGYEGYTVHPTEGGHSDLAATNEIEWLVLQKLARRFGHVSRERAVSIPGLRDIWDALAAIEGDDPLGMPPASVVARAKAGESRAKLTVDLSVGWLGAMVADVALTTGARGGIYLAGEWFGLLGTLFNIELFVERCNSKGRLLSYISSIPIYRATLPNIEMIGLLTLFDGVTPH